MQLGIDFGTWYTSAVLWRGEGQPLTAVKDPSFQGASIPSCLYLNNDSKWSFGHSAWASRRKDPNRFIHSELKGNLLSHGGKEPISLGDSYFSLEELIGQLLGWIKQEADRMAQSWGELPLDSVILTVPVDYGPARREVMEKAATLAGFKHIELLDEPVAAALSVLKQGKIQSGETVLIYDLGGGTFDAALVRQNGNKFEVLAKDGLPQCGGVHFDHAIYSWLSNQVTREQSEIASMLDRKNKDLQARRLRLFTQDGCREAKHQLSSSDSWEIEVPAGEYPSYRLNRQELEGMLVDHLDQTMATCRRVLKQAKIKPEGLGHIVMVGGSTRIPVVSDFLKEVFGKEPILAADPELAIAEGAVLRESIRSRSEKSSTRDRPVRKVKVLKLKFQFKLIRTKPRAVI